MAPLVSHLKELNLLEATAYTQGQCFEAGVLFARSEGIVPAPEANHAVKGAIEEALRCKREGKSETILFNLCGHGHFDMTAYQKYFAGELKDEQYDEGTGHGPVGPAQRAGTRLSAHGAHKGKRRESAAFFYARKTSSSRSSPPMSMATLAWARTRGLAR
jgi:hypothetical protein